MAPIPPDQVSETALDWALRHLRRFGDTDLFPVAFELDAIAHNWTRLKPLLSSSDLKTYKSRASRRFLVPKALRSFRVATQLDPMDAVLYTAAVYEAADLIEKRRVPAERQVACSYRIKVDPAGSFFSDDAGWKDFHERSTALAEDTQFSHVVTADIADFYGQVSHHRIHNALEDAGVDPGRAVHFEELLMKFTAKQSRGLPVGPAASIVLAEACLNDVDSWLLNRSIIFTRYVDDFRIFCKSRADALLALHDLTDYLYTAHRLALQGAKTRIWKRETFLSYELRDPKEEEERGRVDKLSELVSEMFYATGVEATFDDIKDEDNATVIRQNLGELFDAAIAERTLHLGLILRGSRFLSPI